eukprot:TRINITY_DN39231_c0_g1_i1.p1 TRINITY_DN39231_c0_g1~~TRINITY_DN39231_c0_g1_i1.p1  ORF type:complete len:745 (+),score=140.36 TRINITY_DN39231_c0_g1_i1:99-2333(+)
MPIAGGFGGGQGPEKKQSRTTMAVFGGKRKTTSRTSGSGGTTGGSSGGLRAARMGIGAVRSSNIGGLDSDDKPISPKQESTKEPNRWTTQGHGHRITVYGDGVAGSSVAAAGVSWAKVAGSRAEAEPGKDEEPKEVEEVQEQPEPRPAAASQPVPNGAPPARAQSPPLGKPSLPSESGGLSWAGLLASGRTSSPTRGKSPTRKPDQPAPAAKPAPPRGSSPTRQPSPTSAPAPAPAEVRGRSPPRGPPASNPASRTAPARAAQQPAAAGKGKGGKGKGKSRAALRYEAQPSSVAVPFNVDALEAGAIGWGLTNGQQRQHVVVITAEQASKRFHAQEESVVLSDSIKQQAPASTGRTFTFGPPPKQQRSLPSTPAAAPASTPASHHTPSPAQSPTHEAPAPQQSPQQPKPPQQTVDSGVGPTPPAHPVDPSTLEDTRAVPETCNTGTSPLHFPTPTQTYSHMQHGVQQQPTRVSSSTDAGTSPYITQAVPPAPAVITLADHMPVAPRGTVTSAAAFDRSQWGRSGSSPSPITDPTPATMFAYAPPAPAAAPPTRPAFDMSRQAGPVVGDPKRHAFGTSVGGHTPGAGDGVAFGKTMAPVPATSALPPTQQQPQPTAMQPAPQAGIGARGRAAATSAGPRPPPPATMTGYASAYPAAPGFYQQPPTVGRAGPQWPGQHQWTAPAQYSQYYASTQPFATPQQQYGASGYPYQGAYYQYPYQMGGAPGTWAPGAAAPRGVAPTTGPPR